MGATVKVKLIRTHLVARPGEIITAFGHKFVMQPDGTAVCDMHKDFIPTEVAARRVEVVEPGPPRSEPVPELIQFSIEIEDYYGTGSIDKLATELSRMRKELLQEFASTRLSVELPETMSNESMIKQIKNLVARAHAKYDQPEQESNDAKTKPVQPAVDKNTKK
jgi:hypothetical protein